MSLHITLNTFEKKDNYFITIDEADKFKFEDLMVPMMYPSKSSYLINGLKTGILYEYVSDAYLNGFINYIRIVDAYMVNRYTDEDEWIYACKAIDEYNSPHATFDNIDGLDDIHILGTLEDDEYDFVYFWFDRDVSDCCIGRFRFAIKNEYGDYDKRLTYQVAKDMFRDYVAHSDAHQCSMASRTEEAMKLYHIPLEKLMGWKRF